MKCSLRPHFTLLEVDLEVLDTFEPLSSSRFSSSLKSESFFDSICFRLFRTRFYFFSKRPSFRKIWITFFALEKFILCFSQIALRGLFMIMASKIMILLCSSLIFKYLVLFSKSEHIRVLMRLTPWLYVYCPFTNRNVFALFI